MKVELDANVLIAASIQEHPHHVSAFRTVERVTQGRVKGCIGTHALAEFYSVLTRAPFSPRVHPSEAGRFLEDNILPHFELVLGTNNMSGSAVKNTVLAWRTTN